MSGLRPDSNKRVPVSSIDSVNDGTARHRGSICCRAWRKNLRRPGNCWSRRKWSVNGLHGLHRGLIWSSLVQSDPAWCLACGPIANWQGAATASGVWPRFKRMRRLSTHETGGGCRRRLSASAWASAGPAWRRVSICVVVWWFVGLRMGVVSVVVGGLVLCGSLGAEDLWDGVVVDWFVVAGLARRCVEAGRWSRRVQSQCCVWLVHKF